MPTKKKTTAFASGWDRDGRTKALIEAAMTVFSERGYDAATTKAIADQAACSEGLIARYFGGKEGLFVAVIQSNMQRQSAQMEPSLPVGGDLNAVLCHIMQGVGANMWNSRAFIRMTHGRAMVDEAFADVLGGLLQAKRREIVQKLATLVDAGMIAPDEDLQIVALAMMSMVFQVGFLGPQVHRMQRPEMMTTLSACAALLATGLSAKNNKKREDCA